MDAFENMRGGNSRLHKKITKYVERDIDSENLFEKKSEIYIDEDGCFVTEETNSMHPANCGHYTGLFDPKELKGICFFCQKRLCVYCSFFKCKRCHLIVCPSCLREFDNLIFCPRCRTIHVLKIFSFFSLRQLHQFLLKEI